MSRGRSLRADPVLLRDFVAERLLARNAVSRELFDREADRLALACEEMAHRFREGGRLLAFGRGASATDAQHVAVEFVHPVIVGKRALPAIDLSASFDAAVPVLLRDRDIVMGFAPPEGDSAVAAALNRARVRGAQTFALPGCDASYAVDAPSLETFVSQELFEILYHTLWETVHVFFEHESRLPSELGESAFLYPFLGEKTTGGSDLHTEVASSIRMKAADDERLREQMARAHRGPIVDATMAIADRLADGATLLLFGNGGSATDANDWAFDCVHPPARGRSIPALSLAVEPSTITAIANDVGIETVFLRQLIAHGREGDIAIAISTSGGSANVIAALSEARKRRLFTIALLGCDGGDVVRRQLADVAIVVPCDYIPRIQEVQASVYHVMTEALQWEM